MAQGWIKIHRQLKECWIYDDKPYDRTHAWIDLLMRANHRDKKIALGNEFIEVKRGSFITSEVKLMDAWGWSKTKLRSFLKMLQEDKMIEIIPDKKKTTINIVNYSVYQESENQDKTTEEPQENQEETIKEPKKDTNKNDKELKNEKNDEEKEIINEQMNKLWNIYPKKKGKDTAFKKMPKLIKDFGFEQIERTVQRYVKEIKNTGTALQYVKQGDTFFNGGYVDYLDKNYKEDLNKGRDDNAKTRGHDDIEPNPADTLYSRKKF